MRSLTRFNLKTLLLVVTAFSIWLGLHVNSARVQKQAVQGIREHDGWVAYDYQLSDGDFDAVAVSPIPEWLRQKLGVDFFHSVAEVSFFVRWDENGAMSVRQNPDVLPLRSLLAGVPRTKCLRLWGTQVTDKNLEAVAALNDLKSLVIVDGRNVSDQGTAHLTTLVSLEWLVLTGSHISDESLSVFSKLPKLKVLNLEASGLTNNGLYHLSGSQRLQKLFLHGQDDHPNEIDDKGIVTLSAIPNLRFLGIKNTQISSDGVDRFTAMCPNCQVLR